MHLFGAGAFNDTLTYFTQLTLADDGDASTSRPAYLLWNDIVGPRHAAQPLGRAPLRAAAHELRPAQLVPERHRDAGRLGRGPLQPERRASRWARGTPTASSSTASSATASATRSAGSPRRNAAGLIVPNAEDVYAHIGVKSGGVALDGEGKYGPNVPDPRKPWAEKSITFDLFAYHGITRLDNGTGTVAGATASPVAAERPVQRRSARSIHAQYDSLVAHGRRADRAARRARTRARRRRPTRTATPSPARPTSRTRRRSCSTTRSTTSSGPGSCRACAPSTRRRDRSRARANAQPAAHHPGRRDARRARTSGSSSRGDFESAHGPARRSARGARGRRSCAPATPASTTQVRGRDRSTSTVNVAF